MCLVVPYEELLSTQAANSLASCFPPPMPGQPLEAVGCFVGSVCWVRNWLAEHLSGRTVSDQAIPPKLDCRHRVVG